MSELAQNVVAEQQPVEQDPTVQPAAGAGDSYAELEDVDFLDDIDFSLEDVESRIAPLALAHR